MKEYDYWLEACRKQKRSRFLKRADTTQHTTFEKAFSNLVHAALKDRAPELIPYELGFQLLERSEDNTRAAGVMVFNINQQRIFLPVVFDSGELKGFDVLVLANQDLFVPLDSQWIDWIIQKNGTLTGSPAKPEGTFSVPQLEPYKTLPKKYAFILPKLVDKDPRCAESLLKMVLSYPKAFEKYAQVYGTKLFKTAMHRLLNRPVLGKVKRIKGASRLSIYTPRSDLTSLSPAEKSKVLTDGILIKDARTVTSKVLANFGENKSFQQVTSPGRYKVIDIQGKLHDVLVLFKRKRLSDVLIYDIDTKRSRVTYSTSSTDFDNKQSYVAIKNIIVAVSDHKDPLKELVKYLKDNGTKVKNGDTLDKGSIIVTKYGNYIEDNTAIDGTYNIYTWESPLIEYRDKNIFIPKESWKLKTSTNLTDRRSYAALGWMPADNSIVHAFLAKYAARINIYSKGNEVLINSNKYDPIDALIYLVKDLGIHEKKARKMLALAEGKPRQYYVKIAQYPQILEQPVTYSEQPASQYAEAESVAPMIPATEPTTKIPEAMDLQSVARLLETSGTEATISQFLPDLIKGMDKIGRLLVTAYWHAPQFKERYGENATALEDAIREAFHMTGKIVLKLKQKAPYSMPAEQASAELQLLSEQG